MPVNLFPPASRASRRLCHFLSDCFMQPPPIPPSSVGRSAVPPGERTGWVGRGAAILLVALCNSSPLFSTHVNGGPRLSMLSVHVGRQMAGEGGRALGGREGGVAGLFPRRQRADPQRLGRAGSRREVRTHILHARTTHTSHTSSLTTSQPAQKGPPPRRMSLPPPRRQTTAGESPAVWARAARPGGRSGAPESGENDCINHQAGGSF